MKYICTLLNNNDDDIIVDIQGTILNCFANTGINFSVGDDFLAEINIFDDFQISPSASDKPSIKQETGYRYTITGILDVEQKGFNSIIFFELDDLYDYGYLDNKMVDISVQRLDISEYDENDLTD